MFTGQPASVPPRGSNRKTQGSQHVGVVNERRGGREGLLTPGPWWFSRRGHDASQITLALGTAASYPRACQALGAMLSKGALNPADITVLFKMFTSMDPPPVELVSCAPCRWESRAPHRKGDCGEPVCLLISQV